MASSVGCVNTFCTRRLNFEANTREALVDAVINSGWDVVSDVFCCPEHREESRWKLYVKQAARRQAPKAENI